MIFLTYLVDITKYYVNTLLYTFFYYLEHQLNIGAAPHLKKAQIWTSQNGVNLVAPQTPLVKSTT